ALSRRGSTMAEGKARRRWWAAAAAVGLVAVAAWAVAWLRGPQLPGYEVVRGPLVHNVVATGRVATPSRVLVGAEISGLVLERRDEARAALEALRSNERPDARARLRQAQAELDQAERELARRRELGERQLVSRESVEVAAQAVVAARAAAEQARLALQALDGGARELQAIQQLEQAEADLARAQIRATVPGTVLVRNVEPGDTVTPGQVLLEIARDAPGEVLLSVDEKNLE